MPLIFTHTGDGLGFWMGKLIQAADARRSLSSLVQNQKQMMAHEQASVEPRHAEGVIGSFESGVMEQVHN